MNYKNLVVLALCIGLFSCKGKTEAKKDPEPKKEVAKTTQKTDHQLREISRISDPIIIDGIENEESWSNAAWYPIDQVWIGKPIDAADFSGRYK